MGIGTYITIKAVRTIAGIFALNGIVVKETRSFFQKEKHR